METNAPWAPIIEAVTLPDGHVIRQLSPDEWHRLADAHGPTYLRPDSVAAVIAVLTPDDRIVGHVVLAMSVFAGDLYVDPALRSHTQLARAFLGAFYTLVLRDGVKEIYALSDNADPDARGRLETLGFPVLPMTVHRVGGGS